jgi:MFS family permease
LFLAARGDLVVTQVAALTFSAFLAGAIACVVGGRVSIRIGEARVALVALIVSGLFCLLSPLAFVLPVAWLVVFVLLWGAAVIADSAQFSALSAHAAPQEYVGTALTIQNAIGFGITFAPLALVPFIAQAVGWQWAFLFLAPGPILGAWSVAGLVPRHVKKPVVAPV